jgi:aminoglycoside phosphotransferase (APT) family kinase protein
MLSEPVVGWLKRSLDDPGPFEATRIGGGNSNETLLVKSPQAQRVLRRPPAISIAPGAHSMQREHTILTALADTDIRVPQVIAFCEDESIAPAPFLVMEKIDGVALTDALPLSYADEPQAIRLVANAVIDELVKLHALDWRSVGLDGFGRPDGFLRRQVGRWRSQYERSKSRELADFDHVARWLESHTPPDRSPALVHGDFHLDNCLMSAQAPVEVAAIIDWEMATVGDPLLDLGLLLAFWGDDRPTPPAIGWVQAVTRAPGAPSRAELAERYATRSGADLDELDWYLALAFWKLAAIVEGAHAQYRAGELSSDYARDLEDDVPRLLAEAAAFTGRR